MKRTPVRVVLVPLLLLLVVAGGATRPAADIVIPPYFLDDVGSPGQNLPVAERQIDVIATLPDGRRFEVAAGTLKDAVSGEPLSYGDGLLLHTHEPSLHRYLNGGANASTLVDGKPPAVGSWAQFSSGEIRAFFLLLQEGASTRGYAVRLRAEPERISIKLLDLAAKDFRKKVGDERAYTETVLTPAGSSTWKVNLTRPKEIASHVRPYDLIRIGRTIHGLPIPMQE